MPDESASTRERLLSAAERLFAGKDPDQVSLRLINAEAGLNPAAVHYHFGSREGLVTALLERELIPLWADRLAPVVEASERPDAGPLPIAGLVAAIVEPFEELIRTEKGRMLCRLLARTALPDGRLPVSSPWFSPAPFEVMLSRAMPELPVREISERWRLAFTLLLEIYGRAAADGRSPVRPEALVSFLTAGLTAPARG
ncbi:TetR/AcrR family transcriptional regulator [Actinomadura sp. NAK00032]|uniref:TetR/AcrR family transcriptional regulator n=1 Tax=Actinomadura sp. NAK00032 TaxID=2742128 RepID=UPI001591ECC6|nr:TetR/AcrR family transcriptional regulator [Actinomadura sp. NAK00032]QKW36831.1 TetR/AcrR family transcriptional regulator [Actinomadura sp. NAK00032]